MASRTHLKFLDAYGVSKFQNMGSRGHFPLSLVTWGKQVIHSSNGLSHTQKGKMNWTNSYSSLTSSEENIFFTEIKSFEKVLKIAWFVQKIENLNTNFFQYIQMGSNPCNNFQK